MREVKRHAGRGLPPGKPMASEVQNADVIPDHILSRLCVSLLNTKRGLQTQRAVRYTSTLLSPHGPPGEGG